MLNGLTGWGGKARKGHASGGRVGGPRGAVLSLKGAAFSLTKKTRAADFPGKKKLLIWGHKPKIASTDLTSFSPV